VKDGLIGRKKQFLRESEKRSRKTMAGHPDLCVCVCVCVCVLTVYREVEVSLHLVPLTEELSLVKEEGMQKKHKLHTGSLIIVKGM
jgi:hypothetical protein